MKVGSGSLQYELVEGWERLPAGWSHPDVAGVCTDSKGNVYLFCRAEHPVIVYDREGHFLDSWGEGLFSPREHGTYMTADDQLYLVDDKGHNVRKFTTDGKLLQTIGPSGVPSDSGYDGSGVGSITRGAAPYNRPTNLAVAPSGDLYISDGYGNARVHRFSAQGEHCQSWGEPGIGSGEFHLPHSVWVHTDGRVFVADRENERIQIFGPTGEYLAEWTDVQRPQDIYIDKDNLVYVAELDRPQGLVSFLHGTIAEAQPGRISIYDIEGNLLLRWGGLDMVAPGNFVAPHGIWVDDRGDIYLAEVTYTVAGSKGLVPEGTHTFQKFARI